MGSGLFRIQVAITFNNNGTFSVPAQSITGKWVQNDGTVLFQIDNTKVTYGGNVVGKVIVGMMSTFEGSNGCWYAIREGTTVVKVEERKPELDLSGNKANQS